MRFIVIFDKVIKERKDQIIPYVGSPITFHTKASDALKFLVENLDQEIKNEKGEILHKEGDYARLRGEVKFRDTKEGLHLKFNESPIRFKSNEVVLDREKTWKDKLDDFLGNPLDHGPLVIKGLALSVEDIAWINNTLESIPNLTFIVKQTELKV